MKKIQKNIYRNNAGLSLIQGSDNREAMLLKMRGKLAGISEFQVQDTAKRKLAVQRSAFGWGWRIGIAAAVALCNYAYFSLKDEPRGQAAREKHIPKVQGPSAALSLNDQALYWAYALYDFDMLKKKYGVPKTATVNAATAKARLNELLPKVDTYTRYLIGRYTGDMTGIMK